MKCESLRTLQWLLLKETRTRTHTQTEACCMRVRVPQQLSREPRQVKSNCVRSWSETTGNAFIQSSRVEAWEGAIPE